MMNTTNKMEAALFVLHNTYIHKTIVWPKVHTYIHLQFNPKHSQLPRYIFQKKTIIVFNQFEQHLHNNDRSSVSRNKCSNTVSLW